VVKYQTVCWFSALPASSVTPVVSTALYLVLEPSKVEGFRVAFRPSVLRLTGALVT
jgi:hypothetical protein